MGLSAVPRELRVISDKTNPASMRIDDAIPGIDGFI